MYYMFYFWQCIKMCHSDYGIMFVMRSRSEFLIGVPLQHLLFQFKVGRVFMKNKDMNLIPIFS